VFDGITYREGVEMGTRSLVTFCSDRYTHEGTAYGGEPVCTVYRQFDGYPEGRGLALAEWLNGFTICNGIGTGDRGRAKTANGIECMAAQWIAYEKRAEYMAESERKDNTIPLNQSQVGSVYMHTQTYDLSADDAGHILDAQWLYRVDITDKKRKIRVFVIDSNNTVVFVGGPARMLKWINGLKE